MEDLAKFMSGVKALYPRVKYIHRKQLRLEIAKKFGASRPTIADRFSVLLEFGFITPGNSVDTFTIEDDAIVLYGKK